MTTWWVGNTIIGTGDISSVFAGVFANTANPFLMCIPLIGYQQTKKHLGEKFGWIALAGYWMTFEFIHLRWDLTWPWLNLGNGFSQYPQVVQWYEYTGTFGGTLWIWIMNISGYVILRDFLLKRNVSIRRKNITGYCLLLFLPLSISVLLYFSYREKGKPQHVVVVQPNIDPYNEKFDFTTLNKQLLTLIELSRKKISPQTDYLVWPETAIPQGIFITDIKDDPSIHTAQQFLNAYPRIKLITGISAYAKYTSATTSTARYSSEGNFYWDAFNSAIQLDTSKKYPIYHKSKLVPGVEKMPYPQIFKFLEPLAISMGGASGSLGEQKDRGVFFSTDSVGVGPEICYESIYGEYSTEYIRRGANLLFIITNDGWWGNSAGHKQHLEYARLLAVETRRDIAQSANTGTSAFINQRGDVSQQTAWWKPAVIESTLFASDEQTFYVKNGDYIGRAAIVITTIFILTGLFKKIKKYNIFSHSHDL